MKKERNPILVIFCILLLLLLIVLPPVFRKYIPKEEKEEVEVVKDKISLLKCNRLFADSLYQVNVSVKYLNDSFSTNTILYQKLDTIPQNYIEKEVELPINIVDEITYLSSLKEIIKNENGNLMSITINDETILDNPTDENLKNHSQQDINNQKQIYEKMGYTCNILES